MEITQMAGCPETKPIPNIRKLEWDYEVYPDGSKISNNPFAFCFFGQFDIIIEKEDRVILSWCFEEYYDEHRLLFDSVEKAKEKAEEIWREKAGKALRDILE